MPDIAKLFPYPSRVSSADLERIKNRLGQIRTPAYVIDEKIIADNLAVLKKIKDATGATILLALKAFSLTAVLPMISRVLDGVCASGLNEARLGREYFRKQVHTFGPAYSDDDIAGIIKYSNTIIFNSFYQLKKYGPRAKKAGKQIGLRVNPGASSSPSDLYNPCTPGSRLGITVEHFEGADLSLLDGLHFHALCEQDSRALEKVIKNFEKNFGRYISGMKWINFGGGHHITRHDYDTDHLIRLINDFQKKYGVKVHLEPGEAVVLNAGYFVATVLDLVDNCMQIAILDGSAETHMPDVLAMPYRPRVLGADEPKKKKYTYRLGGPSCLAGDTIGDYSFDRPLTRGDKIVFTDMALYTFVKNTSFNGIPLPDIGILRANGDYRVARRFGYKDFLGKVK